MKKVTLTPKEFVNFKQIATFFFNFAVSAGMVIIEADAHHLESLGY
jgi:hypothetical protein